MILHEERQRLEHARRTLAGVSGVRTEISARIAGLTSAVSLAKGRSNLKGRIETFLEDLQAEAHKRNVGSFERLLTLLVSDVLPGANPIGLELSTERGLPSLDIFSVRPDGMREDVYLDHGGALTNIVSAGLRIIAAVKSRGRRFLLLDEPDCWIQPERVADFYRVFRQAAEQVGVQCLVISHHSQSLLGDGIAIARLETPTNDSAVIVPADDTDRLWTPEMPGIRAIRMENFQAHPKSELKLGPGVTALIGPNDRGKSCVVRALDAILYGETRENLIRFDEKQCAVEIDIEGGRTLALTRARRRNPVNIWTLKEASGAVVDEDGVRYETGGRGLPDWVPRISGIATVDGMHINVSNQKQPVFLLAEAPSRRAAVLSVGQESSHLRDMITLQRERSTRDLTLIRDGEKEIGSLEERLRKLPSIETVEHILGEADGHLGRAEELDRERGRLTDALGAIETLTSQRLAAEARLSALAAAPADADRDALEAAIARSSAQARAIAELDDLSVRRNAAGARLEALSNLPETAPPLTPSDALARTIDGIADDLVRLTSASEKVRALTDLPEAAPDLVSSEAIISAGVGINNARKAIEPAEARLAEAVAGLQEVETEMAGVLSGMGNLCPTCGQSVQDIGAFLRDEHPAAESAS